MIMDAILSTASPPRLSHERGPGQDVTTFEGPGTREYHISLRPLPGEEPARTVDRLVALLREREATVVRQEVFGSRAAGGEVTRALERGLASINWPVSFLEGGGCFGGPLAGMHVLAVSGGTVRTLDFQGRPIGRVFGDKWARYCLLGDVRPTDLHLTKPEQARQTFENLEAALRLAGMGMAHLARTWLFLDDLLAWYGPFNTVRTEFFRARDVFSRLVPASTGVSGRNLVGAAMLAGAWAAEGTNGAFAMREVASPKQCPAPNYGSSFSRAVELTTPALKRLMVSGTASIEPGGRSIGDDISTQIDLTMEVVRAILVARGMDFVDASRVTAYFKHPQDVEVFEAWRAGYGLKEWPVVCTQADICRDELLFEIELDTLAIPAKPGG